MTNVEYKSELGYELLTLKHFPLNQGWKTATIKCTKCVYILVNAIISFKSCKEMTLPPICV